MWVIERIFLSRLLSSKHLVNRGCDYDFIYKIDFGGMRSRRHEALLVAGRFIVSDRIELRAKCKLISFLSKPYQLVRREKSVACRLS
jgi:hypothetical protein